jgi:dUTP pyrophosphatase
MPFIRYTTDNDECEPYKKHRYDAGWDLRSANEDFILKVDAKVEINTGIKVAIPRGYVGLIVPRSGMGTKYRVTLANSIGVIDSDYRGEVKVFLVNDGYTEIEIKQYDRICQLLVVPVVLQSMRRVGFLGTTTRGDGGFGHTGTD